MNSDLGLNEFESESNGYIPEEFENIFENQFHNFPFENTSSNSNEEEIRIIKNTSIYDENNFIEQIEQIFNKMNADECSNNLIDNIIEKNNSDKNFENNFNFRKQTIELEENEEKKLYFKTKKQKKRGRKTKTNNSKRKIHTKIDDDNILTKIQVHFLTFLINVSNDLIRQYFNVKKINKYFKQINYDDKKNITTEHIAELKSCTIKDILLMKISKKYRKCEEDNNKQVYNFICEEANKNEELSWINYFFNMNYLEFFKNYYFTDEKKDYFSFQDKKINLSEKTELFYDLLEKNENNPEIKKCLKKISERYSKREKQYYPKIFLIDEKKN